jgi:hypothetical protein
MPPAPVAPAMPQLAAIDLTIGQVPWQDYSYTKVFNLSTSGTSGTLMLDGSASYAVTSVVNSISNTWRTSTNTLSGYGTPTVNGTLTNNGQIIADGGGVNRTLDLSHIRALHNTIDNPTTHGINGLFARNHGKLLLPPIAIASTTSTYIWGDQADDATIDMVNSLRFTPNHITRDGNITIALLAADRSDIPAVPAGHGIVGLWSFDSSAAFDSLDMTIRFDDSIYKNDSSLQLWQFDGAWQRITDPTFHIDSSSNLISGRLDNPTFFAVLTPEPTALTPILLFAATLLKRHHRRRRL